MTPVKISVADGIAIVSINNPPVNAASHAVREGILAAVSKTNADTSVDAVILICEGRTFIAGADIREFNSPTKAPPLGEVVDALEASSKPWVAALHGTALGGGLEVALGCHYRIADRAAKLGFPEVNLGLIPGAGGTVRLPRVIDIRYAVEMISGGKPVAAKQALEWGLIDVVAEAGLQQSAMAFAKSIVGGAIPAPLSRREPVSGLPPEEWDKLIADVTRKSRGQTSPVAGAQAVRRAVELPAADALASESETFRSLKSGAESKALRYGFAAVRSVAKVPGVTAASVRNIQTVGVVGGGTMGAGIAAACLLAGLAVVLVERDDGALSKGLESVRSVLDGSLKRGLISEGKLGAVLAKLSGSIDIEALGASDLVIEAVFEDMDVKQEVFAKIDAATRDDAILATNTSYLDVNKIASGLADPSRVIGLHFFSPAHIMKLLEVIRTDIVSDEVLATALAFAKKLQKTAVISGVCDGFIGNRIMSAYRRECEYMLIDGAWPWDIDAAMREFGFPMGLFEMQDLAGLDISWAMRKRQSATRDPEQRYVALGDTLCEMGRFGRKSGAGWYSYAGGGKGPVPDPVVEKIILEEARSEGVTRAGISQGAIMERILETMCRVGREILEEEIASSPEAIDVVMTHGFGFPKWKGGPMYYRENLAALD